MIPMSDRRIIETTTWMRMRPPPVRIDLGSSHLNADETPSVSLSGWTRMTAPPEVDQESPSQSL